MLKKSLSFLAATLAIYYLAVSVVIRFFLSEIVFLEAPRVETHEARSFTVKRDGVEAIVREYESDNGSRCAIYFPGQHGGIPRYEKEVFGPAVGRGVTVYAISYPGYEGASGKATFESVRAATRSAVDYIGKNTPCKISESVFIGRSLGSAIAFENALIYKPRGLLLDSVSPSIGPVVKEKMRRIPLLWPARILPIERLLEFDLDMNEGLKELGNTPIVIMQGALDILTKPENIRETVKDQPNVELIVVGGASHSTVVVEAGELYFEKLCQLLECKN